MPRHPAAEPGWRVVQRTIIRADQDLDIRPLYVNGLSSFGGAASTARQSGPTTSRTSSARSRGKGAETQPVRRHGRRGRRGGRGVRPVTDDGATAKPEHRLTFGTYFNAFPASYWRRWTEIRSRPARRDGLRLGHAASSTARPPRATSSVPMRSPSSPTSHDDGRRSTCRSSRSSTVAGTGSTSRPATRTVHPPPRALERRDRPDRAGHGLDRHHDVQPSGLLRRPAASSCPSSRPCSTILDEVIVVDQGTQKVRDHALFAAGGRGARARSCGYIEQGNLGGSGGFSRSMDEATVEGRRRLRPAARRRRRLRARGHPARRHVRRPDEAARCWSAVRCSASTTAR